MTQTLEMIKEERDNAITTLKERNEEKRILLDKLDRIKQDVQSTSFYSDGYEYVKSNARIQAILKEA